MWVVLVGDDFEFDLPLPARRGQRDALVQQGMQLPFVAFEFRGRRADQGGEGACVKSEWRIMLGASRPGDHEHRLGILATADFGYPVAVPRIAHDAHGPAVFAPSVALPEVATLGWGIRHRLIGFIACVAVCCAEGGRRRGGVVNGRL